MSRAKRASEIRRGYGIVGYIGPNGSGKSLCAVMDSMASLDAGRRVVSTVRLLDYENPRPCEDDGCTFAGHPDHMAAHPLWTPFRDWSALLDAEHCDVLMDEVTGVASSRQGMSLPGPVANTLVQLRRRDVKLRWTAPSWSRADTIIRECTQVAVLCRGYMPRRVAGSAWRANRLLYARAIDARELDDLTQGVRARAAAMVSAFMWIPSMPAKDAYDTLDQVLALPVVEGGRCVACGGRRSVPACSCDH